MRNKKKLTLAHHLDAGQKRTGRKNKCNFTGLINILGAMDTTTNLARSLKHLTQTFNTTKCI